MPYIPTETIISAAILAALIAGWRYVQQNPQQELIPASVKKTAQTALSNGKGLFEDELTGESSKKVKSGGKKSGSSKKKNKGTGAVVAAASAAVKAVSGTEGEQESVSASTAESKSTKQKKPETLAEKKTKKAPKTEVDDMLPDDQKQPHLARVMKIVPEPTSSSSYSAVAAPHPSDAPSTSAPAPTSTQGKTDSSSDEARKEEFGYEDEDESEEEGRKEEDDGWEVPKKFVGGSNASSFASAAASTRAPSAPTLNRFSLLTDSNPNFQSSSSSSRRKPTSRASQPEPSSTPTKIQRKNANKRDAQKAQKEQEEKERLDRLKSYRAEAAKERAGAGGKKDALGKRVEDWSSSQRNVTPYPPPLPITLDSVVRFLRKTIFNTQLGINIQAGFFLWRKFAPVAWKDRFDPDDYIGLQLWLARYGNAIAALSMLTWAKELLTGQLLPKRIKWKEQIVVVTGGASGIGALLVQAMAKKGAKVVVLDLNQAQESTDLISSYICDVSDFSQVQDVTERIREEVGSPTILVNNAGVVAGKMILDLQERDIQRTFEVNVLSHFWTIKAFLPDMLEAKGGHIVTVSSVLGLAGSARMTDYCASKAALITMHDALRFELTNRYRAPGIKTTLLLPGHIRTPLFDRIQFPRSLFFRFMAPSLKPEEVVTGIMDELYHKRNGVVRMPFYTQTVRFLNIGSGLVPGFIRNFLQWLSQADYAMDSYN